MVWTRDADGRGNNTFKNDINKNGGNATKRRPKTRWID